MPADDLRDRQREAARRAFADRVDAEGSLSISSQRNPWTALDDALAAAWVVRDAELERLRMAAAAAESRADLMLKAIARVRSMADAWARQFPEAMRGDTAAEAVHIATDIKGVTS